MRQATEQYQRAIELDPDADKPRYQLIWAQAALGEPEEAIALYTRRLADSPTDVREHRFLARAYLAARDHADAGSVIAAGLVLDPDDQLLLEARGEVRAATGDPEGALADWRRAVDPEGNLGPVYSSAFLLERLGPHTGFGMAALAVATPWLTISGGSWGEYFFNGVPFYSLLPDPERFGAYTPYNPPPLLAGDEDGEGPRTPSMSRDRIAHDLDELLEAAALLIEDRLAYEDALRQHFARLLRIVDRSEVWSFENLHRDYV